MVAAQKVKHPSLFYTPELIAKAKQRMTSDTTMQAAWLSILKVADAELERCDLNKVEFLSLAYLMTGDTRYGDKLREILLDVIKAQSWSNREMMARKPAWRSELRLAHKAHLCAIAFDAAYDRLSASERKKIAVELKRLALEPTLGDWLLEPTRIHSLNSMGHNWWTSCACMGGILAISLQNELPEARKAADFMLEVLPEWFNFAGDVLQNKPKSFDKAGGMYESLNYANFGVQEALKFLVAYRNAKPGKKLPEIPHLERLPSFFAHVCYPREGELHSINLGDSHQNITAENSLILLNDLGVGGDNTLWYLSQVQTGQNRDGFFLNHPMGFLYMPDLRRAPNLPDYGNSQLFADFGWATMRNSWEKDETMLVVKSGYTWNHAHADANGFILFHKGIDILKEAGHCWYPNPPYRNYFFQSQAHNVVLFNGKGQSREQQYNGAMLRGYLNYLLDRGNVKYLLANGTGPYADNFSRNFRHFLWMDNVIFIIDDLKTHEVGHFEWLWHPNGEYKKNGIDFHVNNGPSSVAIRPIYPKMLAKSNFVHDYPEDLYWEEVEAPTEELKGTEKYLSFHLPAKVDRVKGLTAIIVKDSPNQKELPYMETMEGKDWIGLRMKQNGKVTDLYINQLADGRLMHSNSWIEADGWTTDAYMFAVTYKESEKAEDSKEIVVCYGSALRRGKTPYFSSLSKLFFIQKDENGKVDLQIDGQPKMNAFFRSTRRPAKLVVNGKPTTPARYEDSMFNVKVVKE